MDVQGKRLRLLYPDSTARARQVPVRRDGRGGGRRVLHRRLPAHPRQGDPAGPADAVRRRPARRRGDARPRLAASGLGGEHDRRDRRRLRRTGNPRRGTHDTCCARRSGRGVAMGLEPQVAFELEFYLLRAARPAGGRPSSCRRTACTAPACRSIRRASVDEIVDAAIEVRVPGRGLVQRVRQRRVRGEHQVRRRDPRGRRGVPVQAPGPGDLRAAREARDVPRPAARRSRRQRPARELLVPARRTARTRSTTRTIPRVSRSSRDGASPACWPITKGWRPSSPRTSTRTSACSPTC